MMMRRADQNSSGEILVVEDTPASLKLLSELLGNAGYLVRQAPDGELALWSAQARPPELILLDIRMPGIDGFEVCRRLKADPALSDIPVIFLSAQYDTDDKVRGFEAGAVDFIAKPYQSEEVLARTRAHIHLARTQQALAASNAQLTRTLEELGSARAEIVRSERLAALGALVAGVAHELNTPIGNSVLAASALQDRCSAFFGGMEHGVKRSELERFGADAGQATTLLLRNLHRAADLIECFKQVAVDQTSSQRRAFELATLVDGMAKTLAPSLRKAGAELRVEAVAGLAMDSYPGALCQVLTQLTSNALLHAFPPVAGASTAMSTAVPSAALSAASSAVSPAVPPAAPHLLTIRMEAEGDAVRLEFEDNGVGFPPGGLARAFEPFNSARMGRSSGLGLHMVHNLVNNVLGGVIELASAPGRTCFAMHLPLLAPALRGAAVNGQELAW